jgi:hypothetical protein
MLRNTYKINKLFFLKTLILLVVFVLGGCLAKEIKPVKSSQQAVVVDKKVEGESEKQGKEIDTSNWKICQNKILNIQLKYPDSWGNCLVNENQFSLETSPDFNGKFLNIMFDDHSEIDGIRQNPEKYIIENKVKYKRTKDSLVFALRGFASSIDNVVAVVDNKVFIVGYSVEDVSLNMYSVFDTNGGYWGRAQMEYWLYIAETIQKIEE